MQQFQYGCSVNTKLVNKYRELRPALLDRYFFVYPFQYSLASICLSSRIQEEHHSNNSNICKRLLMQLHRSYFYAQNYGWFTFRGMLRGFAMKNFSPALLFQLWIFYGFYSLLFICIIIQSKAVAGMKNLK